MEVCDLSGLLPTSACRHTRTEWFISGTEPTQTDTFHRQVWIDMLTNSLANDGTPIERRKAVIALDLPVEVQAWARDEGLSQLTDYIQASTVSGEVDQLILLSPQPNTTYRMDPDFDASAQQLPIKAAVGQGISQITIWVDGNQFTALPSPPYEVWWSLSAGDHRVWAQGVNANGELIKSEVVTITVVSQ
jgi:hypothetical protein